MIDEYSARRNHLGQDVIDRPDDQRRNPLSLNHMRDETDGLMAEGSIGDKQSQINGGLLQLPSYRRGEFVLDLLMPPDTAHKRNVNRGQASHDFFYSETRQSGHGENDFGILAWHRADARVVIDNDLA